MAVWGPSRILLLIADLDFYRRTLASLSSFNSAARSMLAAAATLLQERPHNLLDTLGGSGDLVTSYFMDLLVS